MVGIDLAAGGQIGLTWVFGGCMVNIRYNPFPQIIFLLKYGTEMCCLLSRIKYISGWFLFISLSSRVVLSSFKY